MAEPFLAGVHQPNRASLWWMTSLTRMARSISAAYKQLGVGHSETSCYFPLTGLIPNARGFSGLQSITNPVNLLAASTACCAMEKCGQYEEIDHGSDCRQQTLSPTPTIEFSTSRIQTRTKTTTSKAKIGGVCPLTTPQRRFRPVSMSPCQSPNADDCRPCAPRRSFSLNGNCSGRLPLRPCEASATPPRKAFEPPKSMRPYQTSLATFQHAAKSYHVRLCSATTKVLPDDF